MNNDDDNDDNISPSLSESEQEEEEEEQEEEQEEEEEEQEEEEEVVGCEHYVRRCLLVAPCCDKAYVCRHCHNDAEAHEMDRHAVKEVVCAECNERQPVSNACLNNECGTQFAAYFCAVCNFFDDRVERNYYHCDKCGICRVKGAADFVHCDTCRTCVSSDNHRCKAEQFHADCPICLENLFHSTKPAHVPACGHPIHAHCMMNCLQQNRIGCPLCRKTMLSPESVQNYNAAVDALISMHPMQEELLVVIRCNDCDFKGSIQFHPYGMKCGGCGGYNTARGD
jgi:RING finger/CHY zinc finger protein 1